MSKLIMKLFVTGKTGRSNQAVSNLMNICRERFGDDFDVTIIDVLDQPMAAEKDRILATPTLLKVEPLPECRIIGDMSDKRRVLGALQNQMD